MMIPHAGTKLRELPGGDRFNIMSMAAYLTVGIGYLVSVLVSRHLTLGPFALFTALNLAWVAIFSHLLIPNVRPETTSPHLAGLVTLAAATLLCLPLGLGFDWMLPTVTVAIVALSFRWRLVALALMVFVAATVAAIAATDGSWSDIGTTLAQTTPAYLFAMIFSLVMRRQQQLREQAERLAAEVSHSKAELERAHAELRARASQAEDLAIARERNRMAREIHDTLGHYLTILAVQLETALKLEARGDPRLHGELVEARRIAGESLAEVRRSVAALRPADLTAMVLPEALRRLVAESEALLPGTQIALDVDAVTPDVTPEARVALYRCAQEALTNVRKHAAASKVLVRLRVGADEQRPGGREVELLVLDNGSGSASLNGGGARVQPEGTVLQPAGFGLLGMRERIALLGGSLRAGAEPGKGWRVEVRLPLDADRDANRDADRDAPAGTLVTPPSAPRDISHEVAVAHAANDEAGRQ